jgi:polyisoprenoid-binding protein YceI
MMITKTNSTRVATMPRRMLLMIGLVVMTFSLVRSGAAQTSYKIGSMETAMTLSGTSTMHDWTMVAHQFTCDASFDVSSQNELRGIKSFALTLPVKNLKAESAGLTKNAYAALKSDKYPNMMFRMSSAKVTSNGNHTGEITAVGTMTISGTSRPVTLRVLSTTNKDGSISCKGSIPLKMSDYGIKRPSFMLGAMEAGDAMTLTYTLMLVK